MNDKFLIGELAKIFNISTDTLRHYDKINLLKPSQDDNNKYRYYDTRSMFKLSRILFLKNLGISLGEIEDYMNNKNTDRLLNMLHKKNDELDVKIQQLTNLRHKINTKLDLFENAKTLLGQINVKPIANRYGVFLKTTGLESEYEVKQVFIKGERLLKMSSWLVEGQIYTSLPKEDMEKGIFDQYRYFIEVNPLDIDLKNQIVVIPESLHACLTYIGPYEDLVKHYKALVTWIENNNYAIVGDSIEKNIVDSDYADSKEDFITEIQIPISRKIGENPLLIK